MNIDEHDINIIQRHYKLVYSRKKDAYIEKPRKVREICEYMLTDIKPGNKKTEEIFKMIQAEFDRLEAEEER